MAKQLRFIILILLFATSFQHAFAQKEGSYAGEIFAPEVLDDQQPKLEEHLAFYPNPIKDKFSVTNETGLRIVKIEMHAITGNRVKVIIIKNSNNLKDIYIDDLKRGIYFATVHFENKQMVTQKILKK